MTSRVSMADFFEMNDSAVQWLKLVETKMLVDKWMILRTKIVPTIWPYKNISFARVIGGFVRTRQVSNAVSVTRRPDFKQALSTLQQLKEKEEAQRNQRWAQSSVFMVELARFMVDSHSQENHDGDEPSTDRTGWLVECSIWEDSSGHDFLEFNFLCFRWIADSWRRSTVTDGGWKHNTSNDPFSQCEKLQGITRKSHTCEKWIRGNIYDDWNDDTNAQNNKRNNMFNVDVNLKHVNTHEYTNWRLVSAFCSCVVSL